MLWSPILCERPDGSRYGIHVYYQRHGVGGWQSEGPRLREHLRRVCEAHGLEPESLDELRGHHEVVAGQVQVQLLHQLDRVEVLLRDERDRDVVDVQLIFLDKVQQ